MCGEADAEEFEKEKKSLMDVKVISDIQYADRKEFGRQHHYGE